MNPLNIWWKRDLAKNKARRKLKFITSS